MNSFLRIFDRALAPLEVVVRTLNVGGKTEDPRAARLSNFSADAFTLDGQKFASVEGFIQGIKWPEGHPNRIEAFASTGMKAKKLGRGADRKVVWWGGIEIPFGSPMHHEVIELALWEKFLQNPEALAMLKTTVDMILIHNLGHPEDPKTSLPAKVFCEILTRIRNEMVKK